MSKRLRTPSPAFVVALVALFVALGSGAAMASGLISGSQIKNHSIPAKKLTKSAVSSLQGQRGATGAAGAKGATGSQGVQGPKGAQGPQGPGGSIVSYDATASATPPKTLLGTFLGDTFSAECEGGGSITQVVLLMQTSGGSWRADMSSFVDMDGTTTTNLSTFNDPAGTFSSPEVIASAVTVPGQAEESQDNIVQLGPKAGSLTFNLEAAGTPKTCHLSVQSIPESIVAAT
jgi:hypothetical protein